MLHFAQMLTHTSTGRSVGTCEKPEKVAIVRSFGYAFFTAPYSLYMLGRHPSGASSKPSVRKDVAETG